MTLVVSTNMVLSVESIYCYCFKSTKYTLSILDHSCKKHDEKKHCAESTCDSDCSSEMDAVLEKTPCKAKSTITIFSKTDFTKTDSPITVFSLTTVPDLFNFDYNIIFSEKINVLTYTDPSPPEYLITNPYLQSFLC